MTIYRIYGNMQTIYKHNVEDYLVVLVLEDEKTLRFGVPCSVTKKIKASILCLKTKVDFRRIKCIKVYSCFAKVEKAKKILKERFCYSSVEMKYIHCFFSLYFYNVYHTFFSYKLYLKHHMK